MKQADLMDMFNKASRSVCTSNIVVFSDFLSPTLTLRNMKTPENMEVDIDDHEPTDEGDILCLVVQHKYKSSNENVHVRT